MERHGFNPQEISGGKKKFVITDISEGLEAKAKDVALDKSTESTEKPKGFWNKVKNFGKTIWKRSEIFQTKERYKAEKEMRQSGNLFAHEEGKDKKDAHNKEVAAITNRFTASAEFEDEFIHKAAGEKIDRLGNSAAEQTIKTDIQELVRGYIRGTIDEAHFFAAKERIFAGVRGVKPEALGKGKMYADNLFEIAKWAKEEVRLQVEQRVDHEAAINNLDLNFEVVVGKAKAGVRTEAQFNAADRIVDKIQRWTGGMFNEKSVAVGVAIANTFFTKVVQGSVRRAASVFGLGMLASGAAAAGRESRKLEVERMQHAREKAQGKNVKNPALAKRREELEQSRIQTKSAKDLEAGLKTSLFDKLAGREAKDLTEVEYNQALAALSDIKSRIKISDAGIVVNPKTHKWQFWRDNKAKRVDLIGYSDIARVDQERADLDMFVYKARAELNKWAVAHGKDFKADLQAKIDDVSLELWKGDKGIEKQVQIFKKLKRKKVLMAFGKGALIGGAIGLAAQEIHAFADPHRHGIVEHYAKSLLWGHPAPHVPGGEVTLAEGIRRRVEEQIDHSGGHGTTFLNLHERVVDGGHHFKLPEGYELAKDGHGGYQIADHGRVITDSFKLKPDGSLTPEAQKYLADHGFGPHADLSHLHDTSGQHLAEQGHHLTLEETKHQFPGMSKHYRVDWHDNPGPHYSSIHHKLIEFEGKQQELFLEQAKDGTVSMDGRMVVKNLIENLRDRLNDPQFGLNPDGSFDQKLIDLREKLVGWVQDGTLQDHLQVAVIPTDAANHAGLSYLYEGALGSKIALPHEISSLFTDKSMLHDGHLPFKFMEFRIDGHVIATAKGHDFGMAHGIGVPGGHEGYPVTVLGKPENPSDFITVPPYLVPVGRRKGLEEMERVEGWPPLPYYEQSEGYYYGQGDVKRLRAYRNGENGYRQIEQQLRAHAIAQRANGQKDTPHQIIIDRLDILRQYPNVPEQQKNVLERECIKFNERYFGLDKAQYLSVSNFIENEMERIRRQMENLLLEQAKVGETPFPKEFYEQAPMVKGLERSEEIIICPSPYTGLGDAVLAAPLLVALERYFKQKKWNKKVIFITRHVDLFKSLEQQYPGMVEVISDVNKEKFFENRGKKERFIFKFWNQLGEDDYKSFGLTEEQANDPSYAIKANFQSWVMEECPVGRGQIRKYQNIPARLCRGFEIMSGTKLSPDIYDDDDLNEFIKPTPAQKIQAEQLRVKYNISPGEKVIGITVGSGLRPKEYAPEQWEKAIRGICQKYPQAHILLIEDNNQDRMNRYNPTFDGLISSGFNISRVEEGRGLKNIAAIMSLVDCTITPDTGLGHYSAALGKPNIMLTLVNPVLWSTNRTVRVMHPKAQEVYKSGHGVYDAIWEPRFKDEYYAVNESGERVGISQIEPEKIVSAVDTVLGQNFSIPEALKIEIKTNFEQNPFQYIYGDGITQARWRGMPPSRLPKEIFNAYGFSDADYAQAEAAARATNIGGVSMPGRILLELTKRVVLNNNSKVDEWQAANPNQYKIWALDVLEGGLQRSFDSGTLTNETINELAVGLKISPDDIIDRAYDKHPSWKNEARDRLRRARVVRNSVEGDRILRQTLQDIQAGMPLPTSRPRTRTRPAPPAP